MLAGEVLSIGVFGRYHPEGIVLAALINQNFVNASTIFEADGIVGYHHVPNEWGAAGKWFENRDETGCISARPANNEEWMVAGVGVVGGVGQKNLRRVAR